MKRFMQFSIGMLCLSIAVLIGFHMGSQSAQAQSTPQVVGFSTWNYAGWRVYVLEANGDMWAKDANSVTTTSCGDAMPALCGDPPVYMGNFWGEQPINVSPSTLGGVKSNYAPKKP